MANYICKREHIIPFFEERKCERVLDIGCSLNAFEPATHLVDYIDNSHHYPGKEFFVADLNKSTRLDFEDKYFDFVHCSHVLEHLSDPGAIIEEMSRIGKAGYIEVPTKLEDNLFSWHGVKNDSGEYISDVYGHKWWCDYGFDGELVISERLRVLERMGKEKEHRYYATFMESNYYLCILWDGSISWSRRDWAEGELGKLKSHPPFYNQGGLPLLARVPLSVKVRLRRVGRNLKNSAIKSIRDS